MGMTHQGRDDLLPFGLKAGPNRQVVNGLEVCAFVELEVL
jgi:hypothetical protein